MKENWFKSNILIFQLPCLQKFQPQSVDFLEISNPKAVLENTLRHFATLTKGDVISINYNDKIYELCILETRPGEAVSIIECDLNVDFAAPVGFKEPERKEKENNRSRAANNKDKPIINEGYRLDGKVKKVDQSITTPKETSKIIDKSKRGIPDYDYQFGFIKLNQILDLTETEEMQVEKPKEPQGFKLKHIKWSND